MKFRAWLSSLCSVQHLTVTRESDGSISAEDRPHVILVSLDIVQLPHVAEILRAWGYRFVEDELVTRSQRFVRPFALWLVHRFGVWQYHRFWHTIGWLYRRGAVRLACERGVRARLIDIRPWPLRGRGRP